MRLVLVLAAALGLAGCGRAHRACESAWEEGRWAAAVDACGGGDARDMGRLAWALHKTSRAADARAALARGSGAAAQLTRATLDWREGKGADAASALTAARDACRSEADGSCVARAEVELNALHLTRGDLRAALSDVARALAEPSLARDPNLGAQARLRVFDAFYELGDADAAARSLEVAGSPEHLEPMLRVALRLKEGNLRVLQGRLALATQAYADAAEQAERARIPLLAWSARLNLVKGACRDGHAAEARAQLSAAEKVGPQGGNGTLALRYHRGLVLHAEGDLAAAATELDAALAAQPPDDWVWELALERAKVARDAKDLRRARAASLIAAEAAERLRAALGYDELKSWLFESKREPFTLLFSLQADQGDVRGALTTAERMFARGFLEAFVQVRTPSAASTPDEVLTRVEALRSLLPELRLSPALAAAPLDEVLAQVGGRHALVYVTSTQAVWRIELRGGVLDLRRLPVAVDELERAVSRLRRSPEDGATAEWLGGVLLPPKLAGDVYVVATSVLTGLPFAALRTGGRPLMATAAVHLVPSLTAVAAAARVPPEPATAAVVLGDPTGDLPAARLEAVSVARTLGVEPFLGAHATRAALESGARGKTMHLALHGGIGPQGAWVQLGDGVASSADVLHLRLRPRVAVLAACASAATRGRELWGSVAASFLAAGAGSVVAALWSVDDGVTRQFVERFYAEGGAADPAGALARAQRALEASGAPASTWAAFVLLGG